MDPRDGFLDFLLYVSFGSDQFEPYRATYSWGANQMAHAMMGFFLATVWFRWTALREALGRLGGDPWYRVLPFLVPALKVIPDYIYARYLSGYSEDFPFFDAREFLWDKVTDLTFWYLGMFLALAFFAWPWPATGGRARRGKWAIVLLALVQMLAWAYYLLSYWQEAKAAFDDSRLPMIYQRLVNYPADRVEPASREVVADYYRYLDAKEGGAPPARHAIIIGGGLLDRSMLAVSLGSEYTARAKGVYYTTAVKLIEDLGTALAAADHGSLECVIIDDLNVMLRPELSPVERRALEVQSDLEQGWAPDPEAEPLLRSMPLDEPSGLRDLRQLAAEAQAKADFRDVLGRVKAHARRGNIGTIWVLSGKEGDAGFAYWRDFIERNFSPDAEPMVIRLTSASPPGPQ